MHLYELNFMNLFKLKSKLSIYSIHLCELSAYEFI